MVEIELNIAGLTGEPAEIVKILAIVAKNLSDEIALGSLDKDQSKLVGENAGGDGQKALDLLADDAFIAALRKSPVRDYASEEREHIETLNPQGAYGLAIDPLDGSSNIDANVSIGTIFSIVKAGRDAKASFSGNLHNQLVGGYFIYGPQTALVITAGHGTHQFILDRAQNAFRYAGPMTIPAQTKEFAINASNHRHWPDPIRAYVEICLKGDEGPRAKNYNMRWIASLVAETHRILSRGGVFLYTSDERKGYEKGRLRIIYECAPIAFLIEQAGGAASTGMENFDKVVPNDLHDRTGFVFGAKDEVNFIARLFTQPKEDQSPLFRQRGLFSQ